MANGHVDGGAPPDLPFLRRRVPRVRLYLLRTGCPWRYLPRDGFPPRSTVYNIFRKFQREGSWEAIWAGLHMALREQYGARGQPVGRGTRQLIGEIGGKGGGKDDQVGYDAGKKVKGRKIHALVDTEGLPMRVVVHSAAIQDRDRAGIGPRQDTTALPLARSSPRRRNPQGYAAAEPVASDLRHR